MARFFKSKILRVTKRLVIKQFLLHNNFGDANFERHDSTQVFDDRRHLQQLLATVFELGRDSETHDHIPTHLHRHFVLFAGVVQLRYATVHCQLHHQETLKHNTEIRHDAFTRL